MLPLIAFAQYGRAGECMETVQVPLKEDPLPWQQQGLTYTASGYGKRIPTIYKVWVGGCWRRVYNYIFSNSGVLFVGRNAETGTHITITRDY